METSLGPTKNASVNPVDRISECLPPGSDYKKDFFSGKAREERDESICFRVEVSEAGARVAVSVHILCES